MKASFDEGQPIFQQIAEMIEDGILNGTYTEDGQIMSTTQFSNMYHINPATAVKGINLLVDNEILYKRRGLGIFVTRGAQAKILRQRRKTFYHDYVMKLLIEADKICLETEDIIDMINNGLKE